MIVRENRNSLPRFHTARHQPGCERFCHAAQLGVVVALDSLRPLNLNSDILRPALSALDEAVVESGHCWRKYTRKLLTCESAGLIHSAIRRRSYRSDLHFRSASN